jgi:CheY-like chemotaxis protein
LRGSNVTAEISLADSLWPVETDKGQISQVVSNLVINARQAMSSGGVVKISARNITRGGEGEARGVKFVLVQVEDSGPGIAEENLDRIFDPFFNSRESGCGLSLPVAYSIVKKHGGFIEVQSIVGAGTFFYVYLPASEKTPAPVEAPSTTPPHPGSGRVLLMDDDEVIRKLLLRGVRQAGYTADSTGNGAEAVALYRQAFEVGDPYIAVVLDLTVPGGMGGQEAVKELQKLDPQVTAIASSGYSDNPVLANYKAYGFRSALAKPYTVSTLLSALDEAIHERGE